MRTSLLQIALVTVACALFALPAAYAADEYAQLRAQVEAGDFTVDFRALRFAYARTPAYEPTSGAARDARKRLQTALENKDYTTALDVGLAWLAVEYVNPFAHLGIARAHQSLGATDKARFHNRVADGLYDSICRGGEGRTAAAPCPVISLDEEYFYLARHQFEIGSQYEETCEGARPCHVFEVREPNTDTLHDLHFDVAVPLAYQRAHPPAPDRP